MKMLDREKQKAATGVVAELRWLVGQWRPVEGAEDAAWWAHELDRVLSTLRHAVDNDWEDAVAWRGIDDSCDAVWRLRSPRRSCGTPTIRPPCSTTRCLG